MRTLALFTTALLLAQPVLAQDEEPAAPAPDPKRVAVTATMSVDGEPAKPNTLQYFLWERLNHFRLRVDCTNQIGARQFDDYVAKITRWWESSEPDAGPAALTLTARQVIDYNASVFYGQAQAHNFKGQVEATLRDAAGEVVASFAFPFTHGRSIAGSRLTKSQVQQAYNAMVHTGLVLQVLNHPAVLERIPEGKRAALKKWSKAERDKLLEAFEASTEAVREGELANQLRDLPLD